MLADALLVGMVQQGFLGWKVLAHRAYGRGMAVYGNGMKWVVNGC